MTESNPHAPRRRPYMKPRLRRYGTLEKLTRAVGSVGMMDGGPLMGMMKTGI